MRRWPKWEQALGGVLALVSLAVVSYAAFMGNEQALGALMAVVAAATGFYLRGRVDAAAGRNDGG